MDTLHILNGDSTKAIFQKTTIPGDLLVWREVLCEGPCNFNIGSKEFWKERSAFMMDQYQITKEFHHNKSISEWDKFSLKSWNEVVLWFEYDLFCQINMMAILSFLSHNNKQGVSLICVGDENADGQMLGLAELGSERFSALYENRRRLTKQDLEYAKEFWAAYISKDPEKLLSYSKKVNEAFPYLQEAVKVHLMRFPDSRSGIGIVENKILELIASGINSDHSIVGMLLNEDWVLGFGDLQYFNTMDKMTDLYQLINGLLEASDLGLQVIHNKTKYMGAMYENVYLGGLAIANYEYDQKSQTLLSK